MKGPSDTIANNRVRVALPKGRFRARSAEFLQRCGVTHVDEKLHFISDSTQLAFFLVKPADIPHLVADHHMDYGVCPEEWVLEHTAERKAIITLGRVEGWLLTRMSFFGPRGSRWPPEPGRRIATSFPSLAAALLPDCSAALLFVSSSVEALVGPIVDYGFDCIETGATIANHGLVELATPIPRLGMMLIGQADDTVSTSNTALALLRANLL